MFAFGFGYCRIAGLYFDGDLGYRFRCVEISFSATFFIIFVQRTFVLSADVHTRRDIFIVVAKLGL